ncbi:heme ABC exporter ATP-binding protein CcmA [Alphaproteobacteria bacterium]|jgi:heme exporter protein A|nr:heme ABC exporter ATP-binding protein CcmA [Alphaproteobacteria bacterium]
MLNLNNLTIKRGNNVVFSDFNTSFKTSNLTLVIGKNGSGKTTLLRTIAGFIPIENGHMSFEKVDITINKNLWVEKLIYIDTKNGLSQDLTVLENLATWVQMKGWSTSRDNLIKALRSVEMEKYSNVYISQCSEGLKKRAALARLYFSFIFGVEFWLLDEPSNDLDKKSIILFKELVTNFLKINGTIILTTHDTNLFKSKYEVLDLDLLKEKIII